MIATHTWEQAVVWLRNQPEQQDLVRACYYDDPLVDAAERFRQSEEWQATAALLARWLPGRTLDLGAGRGIASYAFARAGCAVTALEPDAGAIVGRRAIEELARTTELPIDIVDASGEELPFAGGTFDVVYGRAVLHHARDLPALCREAARVLRPGGAALWVREHVISKADDLPKFLRSHPLHELYGGEHAYLLDEYCHAIQGAGLRLGTLIGPLENAVNYYPSTSEQVRRSVIEHLARGMGGSAARVLMALPPLRGRLIHKVSRALQRPGRHFAFLAIKPRVPNGSTALPSQTGRLHHGSMSDGSVSHGSTP